MQNEKGIQNLKTSELFRRASSILIALMLSGTLNAQLIELKDRSEKSKAQFSAENLVYGGALGLQFGRNFAYIELAPTIGYEFSDNFELGAGLQYFYYSHMYLRGFITKVRNHVYGGLAYQRLKVPELPIFQHGELNILNYQNIDPNISGNRVMVPQANIGLGYMNGFGGRGPYVLLLYDLLYNANTSRNFSPISMRVGVSL